MEYAKENFFNYKVDMPSLEYAKQYLEERGYPRQAKRLVIVIPDRNEDPEALRATVIQLAMSNFLTNIFHHIDREHFRIDKIIVSDQSDTGIARKNKGLLYTVKDVLYNTLREADIPEIHHLRFDAAMTGILYEHLRDHLKVARQEKDRPILGKGMNMAISSLVCADLTADGIEDKDTVLVFVDAENKEISYRDPFLLGSPLIYEGTPVLFSKAAFRRYHIEGDRRALGGRVNASIGVPLITMLVHEGLMPIQKPICYPLSGEIGIDRELFWSIKIAKKYGVETTTLLQLLGKDEKGEVNLSEENFVQVDLGINMDQPLAEGKPPKEVLHGVRNMAEDIVSATFQLMGKQIKQTWGGADAFMKMFRQFQRDSMERWMQVHDSRLITGGVHPDQLRKAVHGAVREHAEELFLEESFVQRTWRRLKRVMHAGDDMFIPQLNSIRDDIGGKFDQLRERLINKMERILPDKKDK